MGATPRKFFAAKTKRMEGRRSFSKMVIIDDGAILGKGRSV